MVYVVLPYYKRETDLLPEFLQSLKKQGTNYTLIFNANNKEKVNADNAIIFSTKKRLYWTECAQKAYEFFQGIEAKENDCVCFLSDDLILPDNYFEVGQTVGFGEVLIPKVYDEFGIVGNACQIDWLTKKFYNNKSRIDAFSFRGLFIKLHDFKNSGGFKTFLKHYLSDYEFAIRWIKRGNKAVELMAIHTQPNENKKYPIFSPLNRNNPLHWTYFLWLCGRNKYFLLNLIKVWITGLRNK